MHQFIAQRHRADFRVNSASQELNLVEPDGWVAKVLRCPPGATVRTVEIDGVRSWAHYHWLTAQECAHLGLTSDAESSWLLALRPFAPGIALADQHPDNPRDIALDLVYRLRDLHEVGVPHGDLQPGNVLVDRGHTWLIDLAPIQTRPGDAGHVVGSAPTMAPEIWAGASPTLQSDVYALGCVIAWLLRGGRYPHQAGDLAGWAAAHRAGAFDLSSLSPPLQGVLGRALQADPAQRPPIQGFADALVAEGAVAEPGPLVAGGLSGVDEVALAASLAQAGTHVHLVGSPRSGRSRVARRVAAIVAGADREVVVMKGVHARVHAGEPGDPAAHPFAAVVELMKAIAFVTGVEVPFEMRGPGDRLRAFERLTQAVSRAMAERRVVIVWDDFDDVRLDTRAWWDHFLEHIARARLPVSTLVISDPSLETAAVRVELPPLGIGEWNRWRARTLRTEVRDLSQARWDQIVGQADAGTIGLTLARLDREVGARHPAGTARPRILDTGTLQSAQAGWERRVEELAAHCAFGEVIETVSTLYASLRKRGRADVDAAYPLLRAWTEAVVSGGGVQSEVALAEALASYAGDPRFALLEAQLANAMGRHAEGLVALAEVASPDTGQQAEIESWRAQLALSAGRFEEARLHAAAGRALGEGSPGVRAHLEVLALAPDALGGDREAIEALAAVAQQLSRDGAPALLRARAHAYRAIGLTRLGELDAATQAHLGALEQIEIAGLSAELPTYLLNVGTAYHRQGRLGLAREYYARGLRVAQASTRASTRALLHANQANVDLALGRLAEARELVRRGLGLAQRHGLRHIEVMCRSLEGDIELADGDPVRARQRYLAILDDAERLGVGPHQAAEVQLALAEAALLQRDGREAVARLDEARRVIEQARLGDLDHQHGILRARLQWLEGGALGTMAGIELFRRNLLGAEQAGNHRLVLRQAPYLAAVVREEGLTELLTEVGEIVQRARNAIATGLGRELRAEFFAHLPAMDGAAAVAPAPHPTAPVQGPSVEPFYRMLALNEVILRSGALDELLPDVLEIAVSLGRAERAFVLLRDELDGRLGDFRVAASRDVDGRPIPRPHLEVSLTIAEEAARTGRTVVTLNAREDGRFREALSVVDLDLTSVLCVPIRDGSGLLGALYLDHRFHPGVFEGEVPRMMEAFGHQVALGITNARRLAELEQTRAHLSKLLAEREASLVGLERRVAQLTEEVQRRSGDASLRAAFPGIAFGSRAMERVLGQVARVARGDIPVVVRGESGVGKELVARAIHDASPRKEGPFVAFNCGAVTESLFESEMFGHARGAFTGAEAARTGLFAAAQGGTIFLDEIGEMPLAMQVKLLRVLQERQVRRLGENQATPIDVRVVAATNRDLQSMVQEGTFREDLYYRLAAFVIEVPALRERREDIPLIAGQILERVSAEAGRPLRLASPAARLLAQCEWQGNVRELENVLRAAAVMADGQEIDEAVLAPLVRLRGADVPSTTAGGASARGRRRKADRQEVAEALRRAGDDRARAAELLGVSERTLYRYLHRWNLY